MAAATRFYHLTCSGVDQTLATLIDRSLAAGWRVVVRGGNPSRLEEIDRALWTGSDEGFLPHGLAGGAHDALQPVLLTAAAAIPNAAQCLMAVDGAEVGAEDCAGLERVCILFDGNDPEALSRARTQWKALTTAGIAAEYWSEDSGRWQMKSSTAPKVPDA